MPAAASQRAVMSDHIDLAVHLREALKLIAERYGDGVLSHLGTRIGRSVGSLSYTAKEGFKDIGKLGEDLSAAGIDPVELLIGAGLDLPGPVMSPEAAKAVEMIDGMAPEARPVALQLLAAGARLAGTEKPRSPELQTLIEAYESIPEHDQERRTRAAELAMGVIAFATKAD